MQQFVNNKFTQHYKATIGADFLIKQIQIEDKNVTLQVSPYTNWEDLGHCRAGAISKFRGIFL